MKDTKIEWTDATWNPLRGCSKVSEGCRNCYAETLARRFSGSGMPYEGTINEGRWNGQIRLVPEVLDQPLRWKRPRRIFVNSMSDLFHENVPESFLVEIFSTMAFDQRHTFQVLTKRPERMVEVVGDEGFARSVWQMTGYSEDDFVWPLPNVWLGVSVENQKAADERISLLLQTPAAVRFLSMEPLLGPVENLFIPRFTMKLSGKPWPPFETDSVLPKLDWVIVGGESGPGARPMHPDWVRSIRDQCQSVGVPFFFKQWGSWQPMFNQPWETRPKGNCRIVNLYGGHGFHGAGAMWTRHVGKAKAGRELDGRTWDEFPVMQT